MKSYLLSEWQPVRAVLIAWPFPGSDWDESAEHLKAIENCYWGILRALSDRIDVCVLLHSNIELNVWQQTLAAGDFQHDRIHVRTDILYDDTWIRDYGPLSFNDAYVSFTFNGWGAKYSAEIDNQVAPRLSEYLGENLREESFVLEGGALEINDERTLLANKDCLVDEKRNPSLSLDGVEKVLKSSLGVAEFEWIEGVQFSGDDTDGHIDTMARFADDRTIVYCGQSAEHPDAEALRRLDLQINAIAHKNAWRALALPVPLIESQFDGRLLPGTYANFLICNEFVFVPIYRVDEDELAMQVMAKAFPNRTLVSIDCRALLEQHGSLHCSTMQIAHRK